MPVEAPARWWRVVDWRWVAAAGLPAWAAVAAAVWAAADRAAPLPVEVADECEVAADEPLPVGPGGPLVWSALAHAAVRQHVAPGGPSSPHVPTADRLLAAALAGQKAEAARAAREEFRQAVAGMNLPELVERAERVKRGLKPTRAAAGGGPPKEIDGCPTFDTFVAFQRSPAEAFKQAKWDNKLVFVLHLAGNIEDDGFT